MKIARYLHNGKICYGVIGKSTVTDLKALAKCLGSRFPQSIEDFVAEENGSKHAETLFSKANAADIQASSDLQSEIRLLAPISSPPKIICLGRNYIDHSAEMKAAPPEEPVIFMKPHTAIIGPGAKIQKPKWVKQLDYEGELAVVIGKKAKNVSIAEAEQAIFGYMVFNDVSARDIQFGDVQWTRGKSFDTFAPTGPWIVDRNQLPDTHKLCLKTWVNGELRQNASTAKMTLNVDQIVHHLSRVMTLEPCDVIATGTPSGVGFAMKPPSYLNHGDVVRIEIEGIGVLENEVEEFRS